MIVLGASGYAFVNSRGRLGNAGLLESAVQPEIMRHHPEGSAYPFVWLANAYCDAGRLSEAREAATRALDIARRFGELGHEAWARFTKAEIECAAGSPLVTVTSNYQVALDLAERLRMRPLAALCRFGLAAHQIEAKKSGEGLVLLREAQEAFRGMSMTPWLDRANRLLGSEA